MNSTTVETPNSEPPDDRASLVGCEHTEGHTFRVIGQVRFLGPDTDFTPLMKTKIFDWQVVNLYEIPAGMTCEREATAEQYGRLTSLYLGFSGFGVMKTLNAVVINSDYNEGAAKFIKSHARGCPVCWNKLYRTRSHFDTMEADRNTAFSGQWLKQIAKDTVIGVGFLWWLDRRSRRR